MSASAHLSAQLRVQTADHIAQRADVAAARTETTSQVGTLTGTSWAPPEELDMRRWLEHGRRFGIVGRGVAWWIGDWLIYGNTRYGERYSRAARATGYDTQSLMNMVYVASRFPAVRRRPALSWSHHAEVAALPPAKQDYWLDMAERERLSARSLRSELQAARRAADQPARRGTEAPPAGTESNAVCPTCRRALASDADRDSAAVAEEPSGTRYD